MHLTSFAYAAHSNPGFHEAGCKKNATPTAGVHTRVGGSCVASTAGAGFTRSNLVDQDLATQYFTRPFNTQTASQSCRGLVTRYVLMARHRAVLHLSAPYFISNHGRFLTGRKHMTLCSRHQLRKQWCFVHHDREHELTISVHHVQHDGKSAELYVVSQ